MLAIVAYRRVRMALCRDRKALIDVLHVTAISTSICTHTMITCGVLCMCRLQRAARHGVLIRMHGFGVRSGVPRSQWQVRRCDHARGRDREIERLGCDLGILD